MVNYINERSSGGGGAGRPVARQLFGWAEATPSEVQSLLHNNSSNATSMPSSSSLSLARLLVAFDDSWLEYLDQFVVWKGRDAAALEGQLTQMAMKLERSMRAKLGRREVDSQEVTGNPDLQVSDFMKTHHRPPAGKLQATGCFSSILLVTPDLHFATMVDSDACRHCRQCYWLAETSLYTKVLLLPPTSLLQAMVSQVSHDHSLLAERIARLTGSEGSARLHAALQQVRQEVLVELQAAEEEAELESAVDVETSVEGGPRCAVAQTLGDSVIFNMVNITTVLN